MKIKIRKSGPYIVSGGVPLREKVITPAAHGYKLTEGRALPQAETYTLCRCGQSKNSPFCDGAHARADFNGEETASRAPFKDRAQLLEGYSVDLLDDGRCAYSRFCHTQKGDVWTLAEQSDAPEIRDLAIRAAGECISGRLVPVTKDGERVEPELPVEISIIQDPEEGVSGGIYVTGGIPVESADGGEYERQNRLALCRCGRSLDKPYCDGAHIGCSFADGEKPGSRAGK